MYSHFIMEYENYTFREALKHLADRAGVELPKIEYSREVERESRAEEQNFWKSISRLHSIIIISSVPRAGRSAMQYLTGRGLSEETMRKFGLGYSDKYGS